MIEQLDQAAMADPAQVYSGFVKHIEEVLS